MTLPQNPFRFLKCIRKRGYKKKGVEESGEEKTKVLGFTVIRESFRNLQAKNPGSGVRKLSDSGSFSMFKEGLNVKLDSKKPAFGGSERFPVNIFGMEAEGKGEGGVDDALRGEFFKSYTNKDLGMKLIKLRPEKKKDERNWLSLQKLSCHCLLRNFWGKGAAATFGFGGGAAAAAEFREVGRRRKGFKVGEEEDVGQRMGVKEWG